MKFLLILTSLLFSLGINAQTTKSLHKVVHSEAQDIILLRVPKGTKVTYQERKSESIQITYTVQFAYVGQNSADYLAKQADLLPNFKVTENTQVSASIITLNNPDNIAIIRNKELNIHCTEILITIPTDVKMFKIIEE